MTTTTKKTVVARIPQVDGGTRVVYAQDAAHARIAQRLLKQDPAWIHGLHGVDGIEVSVRDES